MDPVADILWKAGCIHISIDSPFLLPNGSRSPFYLDIRRVFGFPRLFAGLVAAFSHSLAGPPKLCCDIEAVGGDATAGIPIATAVALALDKPLFYFRKEVKGYGTNRLIEGASVTGERVAVVTDLVNTGNSLRSGLQQALREGATVSEIVAVTDRHLFVERNPFDDLGLRYRRLVSLENIFLHGAKLGLIDVRTLRAIDQRFVIETS